MKITKNFRTIALLACITSLTGSGSAAIISGTGYSVDNIVEAGAASGTSGSNFGFVRNIFALYEQGFSTGTAGLPSSGLITTQFGTDFQLASFTGNNTLLSGNTFTLNSPASYSSLQFFITGVGNNRGVNNFNATLNFSDASSTLLQFSVADWQSSRAYDAFATKTNRLDRRDDSFGTSVWARELDFSLSPADQDKTLESIDFVLNDRLGLAAVSGDLIPAVIPEPSSVALIGLGGIALLLRRRK